MQSRPSIRTARGRIVSAHLAVAALVCAASPALAQHGRADQLLSNRPPPRRGCSIVHDPGTLPSVAQLADSAAFAQAVAAYAEQYPVSGGGVFALYSIAFDANGTVERVRPLEWMLPQGHDQELTGIVRGALKEQPRGHSMTMRLKIEPGPQPVFRVGRSEQCEPLMNVRFGIRTPANYPVRNPPPLHVRLVVAPDGHVSGFSLLSGSGNSQLDSWVEDNLRRMRLTPGLIDGVAVEMELEQHFPWMNSGTSSGIPMP